jgi:hypothetical protein
VDVPVAGTINRRSRKNMEEIRMIADKEQVIAELTRMRELADCALEVLKKQEPQTRFRNGVVEKVCPVCGSVLSRTTHCIPE